MPPPAFPFDKWTEQNVRECVIRPLLTKLNYTADMIVTERPLVYDRLFLGRKKPDRDRPLRGVADYICEVDGKFRLVVEAKQPGEITDDDREQAYSYAIHPEVRAVLLR